MKIRTKLYGPYEMRDSDAESLQRLLAKVADDFVPSLTVRSGTTQADLRNVDEPGDGGYFHELLKQHNFLLFTDGYLQAFLSFRMNHNIVDLPDIGQCVYVSTLATCPNARGKGYARILYETLFEYAEPSAEWVALRTWSTNTGHIRLLQSLGFELLLRIADDRGGGIDTLYFGRHSRGVDRLERPHDSTTLHVCPPCPSVPTRQAARLLP